MAKKDTNLNITINNPVEDDEPVVSLSTMFRKFKKYFIVWLVTAVVFVGIAFGYAGFSTHVTKPELSALVSFSYDGVEKGLDPNGRKFDIYSIKNPAVIERALTELEINLDQLEPIRQGITFKGRIPADALDRLTLYEGILNNKSSNSITAAEKILETTYFPTQYEVYFNYNNTSLTDKQAVDVLNTILTTYTDYFYELYGYNEAVGNALSAVDYTLYDYSEAVDVFSNSLTSLRDYVKQLADDDETRFRSADTGYTFNDLYQATVIMKSVELDKISSYISVKNITKDKDAALAYYEHRIKELGRMKAQYEETLAAIDESIEAYQKDQIIVYGSTEGTNMQSTVNSKQYDDMFAQRNKTASALAEKKQQIQYYKDRQTALSNSTASSSKADIEKVEADLAALNDRIQQLVDDVCATSEDYYKNVTFSHAYNVLVPASNTTSNKISRVIDNAKLPLIFLEAIGIVIFCAVVFITAVAADNKKRKNKAAMEEYYSKEKDKAEDDDEEEPEEEEDTDDSDDDAEEDSDSEKKAEDEKKKPANQPRNKKKRK